MLDYFTTKEAAFDWGVTPRAVRHLLSQGRVTGAVKVGGHWFIPLEHADKPQDLRSTRERVARLHGPVSLS